MPFIHIRTTKQVEKKTEQTIVAHLGSAMPLIGKSERWLMCGCEGGCHLYFQGSDDKDLAFVTVALFGAADEESYAALTKEITDLLCSTLHIAPDCIYIQYQEASTWGWNGSNF